jgi:hypothetical protein
VVSIPDEINGFFNLSNNYNQQYDPGIYSASNSQAEKPASGSKLSRKWGNLDVSQPYGPPQPVARIDLYYVYNISAVSDLFIVRLSNPDIRTATIRTSKKL